MTIGQRVLDIAAGTGALAVMAAAQVGVWGRVVAADLSLPMLRVAKGTIAGLAVDPVVMDGQDLACRDGGFDVVICQLGLMFFPDARRGLQEFRRVLRGRGRLAVQVWSRPDRVPFFGMLADALSQYFADQRDALYLPAGLSDHAHLQRLLVDAGFRDVSVVAETRELAFDSFEQFGVDPTNIRRIRRGETWRT